ncbi:MAG: transposase [Candidatus Aenigmarchaeota archaeon]|nr:transposase [Candidatus Aenigmarchaeota archaeon]
MVKKKVNARFGARYGKRIRAAVLAAESRYAGEKKCPSCSRTSVRRISTGIWKCSKCNVKFASGAYDFGRVAKA